MKKVKFWLCISSVSTLIGCMESPDSVVKASDSLKGVDPSTLYSQLPETTLVVVDSSDLDDGIKLIDTREKSSSLAKASASGAISLCNSINYAQCSTVGAGGDSWFDIWDRKLDYNDLRLFNPWGNDNISSIKITPNSGAFIYLCDPINWGGPCYLVTESIPDFRYFPINGSTFNFNDRVSSFKFQESSTGSKVTLYDGNNFSGSSCDLLEPFDYNIPPCGFNDKTSSYKHFGSPWNYVYFYKSASYIYISNNSAYWGMSAGSSEASLPAGYNNEFSSVYWGY